MERNELSEKLLALTDHVENQCWTFSMLEKTNEEKFRLETTLSVGIALLEQRKANDFTRSDSHLYHWHCQLADMAEKASETELLLSRALRLIRDIRDRLEGGDVLLALNDLTDASLYAGILLALPSVKASASGIMSTLGKRGAQIRHAETRSMREFAKQYWRDNIERSLSNDKAAELLTKVVALSHRKLSEIVSEARKETVEIKALIPPGGKT